MGFSYRDRNPTVPRAGRNGFHGRSFALWRDAGPAERVSHFALKLPSPYGGTTRFRCRIPNYGGTNEEFLFAMELIRRRGGTRGSPALLERYEVAIWKIRFIKAINLCPFRHQQKMVEVHERPAIRTILGLDNVETVVRPAIRAARFECD